MDFELLGEVVTDENTSKTLLYMINQLLGNDKKDKFPGYQPVSFMKSHIKNLLTEDYLVCEKSDGIRALLFLFTDNGINYAYFLDRKNTFRKLEGVFPKIGPTLFDGEFVKYYEKIESIEEEELEEGEIRREYLETNHYIINDTLLYNAQSTVNDMLIDRLTAATLFMKCYDNSRNELRISIKEMTKSYGLEEVYKKIVNLKHKNDGLIFTPINDNYRSGTSYKLLKWKPAHLNSVDFKLKVKEGFDHVYDLFCVDENGLDLWFDYYFDMEWLIDEDLDDKLGEFKYEKDKEVLDIHDMCFVKGGWELIKIRTDKDMPNSISVVINVINSIKEDVSIENLIDNIKEMRKKWKIREYELEN